MLVRVVVIHSNVVSLSIGGGAGGCFSHQVWGGGGLFEGGCLIEVRRYPSETCIIHLTVLLLGLKLSSDITNLKGNLSNIDGKRNATKQ